MKKILVFLLLIGFKVAAQQIIPFSDRRWSIEGKEALAENWQGQQCLKITNGTALLKDADFKNGVIEFDISLQKARYFPGIGFRMTDEQNGEIFYLRPHQSGNPDAMQYYPEYHDSGGWQLYYGDGFNNDHELPFDRWLHIRILLSGSRGEVYFDREAQPILVMNLRKTPGNGMIILENQWPVPVRYANFSYKKDDAIVLTGKLKPPVILDPGMIMSWNVSGTFSENLLKDKTILEKATFSKLDWQVLRSDERGIADFSEISTLSPENNTVFVRMEFESQKVALKKFTFGFSDRAKVYLNGKLIYAGEDNFLSRDYRFLGTVGFWDVLYLRLLKGKNELWIAISEDLGGWGIKGKLENL
jgi:hypothetical protein